MTDLTIVESLISDLRERVTSLEEQQIDTDKALAWVTGVAADVKGLNLDGLFRRVTALEAQQAKLIEIADRGLAPEPTVLGPPDVDPWPPEPQRGPQTEASTKGRPTAASPGNIVPEPEVHQPEANGAMPLDCGKIEIRVGQRWRHRSTHAPVVRVVAVDGGIYKWTLEVEKTGDVCRVSDQWFANAIIISELDEPRLTRAALLNVADDLCKTNLFDRDEADYDEDDAVAALLRALAEVEPEVWAQITDTLLGEGHNEDKSMGVLCLLAEMGDPS